MSRPAPRADRGTRHGRGAHIVLQALHVDVLHLGQADADQDVGGAHCRLNFGLSRPVLDQVLFLRLTRRRHLIQLSRQAEAGPRRKSGTRRGHGLRGCGGD